MYACKCVRVWQKEMKGEVLTNSGGFLALSSAFPSFFIYLFLSLCLSDLVECTCVLGALTVLWCVLSARRIALGGQVSKKVASGGWWPCMAATWHHVGSTSRFASNCLELCA